MSLKLLLPLVCAGALVLGGVGYLGWNGQLFNLFVPSAGVDDGPDDVEGGYTHEVAGLSVYYTESPYQIKPPEGTLPPGTRVKILKQEDGFVRVRTENGLVAYIGVGNIRKLGEGGRVTADVRSIARGNNRFAVDLYGQLAAKEDGNLFFSPANISTALAMTHAGANGVTEKEMAAVLHFELPDDRLNAAYRDWRGVLHTGGRTRGYELRIANRLWGQKDYGFRPEFLNTTDAFYGAGLAQVDYVKGAEEVRAEINDWVEKETAGRIRDLIPRGSVGPMTRLVLTSAIYFKGDWTTPFDPRRTQKLPFHVSANRKVDALLMYRKDHFGFKESKELKVLELPYGKDRRLSMLVLLPQKNDGLPAVEKALSVKKLNEWTSGLRNVDVKVWLPKFRTTSQFELGRALQSLGMQTAFDPARADFTGMSSHERLFLSAVIHKAFVDVNEKGTEAAAATGAIGTKASLPVNQPEFRADHPFLFLIRDNRSGGILFLGRLSDPTR